MPVANLTKRSVDAARPKAARYTLFDNKLAGFGLRVFPSGQKSWIVEYRPGEGGRSVAKRRMTIGSASAVTADQARAKAEKILARARLGDDPGAERMEARAAITVRELVATFLADHVSAKRRERTAEHYRDVLDRLMVPELGTMKAVDVKVRDVARLHLKWKRTPVQANRLLAVTGSMFTFAMAHGLVPKGDNPARGVEKYPERSRERFLSTDELERLGRAIRVAETTGLPWTVDEQKPSSKHVPKTERATKIDPHAAAALRLLLFTGCRLREILHLRWSEVDSERGVLNLPISKTGRKVVILNAAALAVLEDLTQVGEYVIAGTSEGPRHDLKRPWNAVLKHAGLEGVRLHDLRHTFASYGAGGGLGLPILGKLLGHAEPRTTNRYAHLDANPLRRATDAIGAALSQAMEPMSRH